MALFLSKSLHKIDKKGRVSIPAPFRAALGEEISQGLALSPSLRDDPCVEGGSMSRIEGFHEQLAKLDPHGDEYFALASVLLADMRVVPFDPEGRVALPEEFIALALLKDEALFAGLGGYFQIWNPAVYEEKRADSRRLARASAHLLGRPPGPRLVRSSEGE